MKQNMNIPDGTRDLIYDEASLTRSLSAKLNEIFFHHGFRGVMTPAIEYYDVFRCDKSIEVESMYKTTDSYGRLIAFRADNTLPMVRIASTKLKNELLPLKLCYNQPIYRINRSFTGKRSEILQSGVEIFGAEEEKGDIICLLTAIDALEAIGLPYKLELGNADYFNSLLSSLNIEDDKLGEIRLETERKNLTRLSAYPVLSEIPLLYGGKEIFSRAKALAGDNSKALAAAEYVEKVYSVLDGAGYGDRIAVDMGMVHEIDYYNGLVFRAYVEGAGDCVLTGGRYDRLTGAFSLNTTATGFAINVSLLADTLMKKSGKEEKERRRAIIFFTPDTLSEAVAFRRRESYDECQLSPFSTLKETLDYADKKKIGTVIDVSGGKAVTVRAEK